MIGNDKIFEAMAEAQCRRLLLELAEREALHVSELSADTREIAEANRTFLDEYLSGSLEFTDVDGDLLRKRRLHLPKLAEDGFVEWERDDNLVTKGRRFEELTPLLELVAQRDDAPIERESDRLVRE